MHTGSNQSRRKFLRNAGLSAAALAGFPALAASSKKTRELSGRAQDFFEKDNVILFQGDSITDAKRDRELQLPNNPRSFGGGYAFLIASELLKNMPEYELAIHNRGISGNKVYQLSERWDKDCIDLKPDVLSILIGVNDYWHLRSGKYDGTPQVYEKDFRQLLIRTRKQLPGIKLVICEPFILAGTSAVDESWLKPFSEYQKIAAKLATEFEAVWVPFQKAFDEACKLAPATYWTADGVHPSMAGCQLMAETWLKAVSQ